MDVTANSTSRSVGTEALDQLETEMSVLARRLEHAARRAGPRRRLDRAGYLLARTLDRHGPTTVNQWAQRLGLDGSTVTRQGAALAERGYVRRSADPSDGRAVVLTLTAAGRREMEAVRQVRLRRLGQTVSDWPVDDVRTLAVLLGRLNQSLVTPDTDR
jgi:DNA-binding MarR family transcriptional regulator